jgi:hypothetical protein
MLSNLVWAIRMECPLTIDRPFTMTHREDFRLANRQLAWSTPGSWFGSYHGVDQSHFNGRATVILEILPRREHFSEKMKTVMTWERCSLRHRLGQGIVYIPQRLLNLSQGRL